MNCMHVHWDGKNGSPDVYEFWKITDDDSKIDDKTVKIGTRAEVEAETRALLADGASRVSFTFDNVKSTYIP